MAKSPWRGPRLENSASWSLASTAPTVSAASAAPGELMVCGSGPALPAATTNSVPVVVSRSSAWLSGSLPSLGSPPRLRLATLVWRAAAHSMPAITPDSKPNPVSSRTLALSRAASNATPLRCPSAAAPAPAMVAATRVPWPRWSPGSGVSEKLAWPARSPARSGCVASMPLSRTATVTPAPVRPACQAAGAPIWVRLASRSAAWTRRSSQMRRTPASGPAPAPSGAGAVVLCAGCVLAWAAASTARRGHRDHLAATADLADQHPVAGEQRHCGTPSRGYGCGNGGGCRGRRPGPRQPDRRRPHQHQHDRGCQQPDRSGTGQATTTSMCGYVNKHGTVRVGHGLRQAALIGAGLRQGLAARCWPSTACARDRAGACPCAGGDATGRRHPR